MAWSETTRGNYVRACVRYASDLTQACGIHPAPALLHGVTAALGPLVYDPATETLSPSELPGFAKTLTRKLGPLPALDEALQAAWEAYETQGPRFRAVLFYILVQHYGKQALFRPKAG